MIREKELLERLEQEGLYAFNAMMTSKAIDEGVIKFDEFEEFMRFIKLNNIKNIFYFYIYLNKEDFLISDELQLGIESDIYKLIKQDIEEYNEKIESFDFTRPERLLVFCLYNDKLVWVVLQDFWDEENNLMKAEEMVDYFQENYEYILEQKEIEREEKLELLKDELREYMLNDDNFKICTNRELRRNYGRTLEKNKKMRKYLEAFSDYGNHLASQTFLMFIEVVWAEYKNFYKK